MEKLLVNRCPRSGFHEHPLLVNDGREVVEQIVSEDGMVHEMFAYVILPYADGLQFTLGVVGILIMTMQAV